MADCVTYFDCFSGFKQGVSELERDVLLAASDAMADYSPRLIWRFDTDRFKCTTNECAHHHDESVLSCSQQGRVLINLSLPSLEHLTSADDPPHPPQIG